jgi:hypothetical protein
MEINFMHAICRHDDVAEFFKEIGTTARYQPSGEVEYGPGGFIHHPSDFPLQCRRVLSWRRGDPNPADRGNLGVCFESPRSFAPGNMVELSVRLRGESQRFRGEVVLVRETGFAFEVGVWMSSREAAARLRIVEQICHIECYLNEKRERDGHTVTRENAAQEWISKFASTFPVF